MEQVVHKAYRRRRYCGSGGEPRTQLPADRCHEKKELVTAREALARET